MEDALNNKTLFFDSYALIEIYNGNKNYEKYNKLKAITTYFQVYEVCYQLRKIYSEEQLKYFFTFLKGICVNLDFNWINSAVKFRLENKKNNLSYADCLGYIISLDLGIKFLTGDKEFENIKNVEFVK